MEISKKNETVFGGKKNEHSGFWIPDSVKKVFDVNNIKKSQIENQGKEGFTYILQLAEIKRAIKNFVQILTGRKIEVNYLENESSGFTDGKQVYISGDIDKDLNFDKTVGLALHEASHIVLTNIEELKAIQFDESAKRIFNTVSSVRESLKKHIRSTKDSTFSTEKIDYELYAIKLKNLLNWVEDRRVDAYIQKDSPGYVGYYQALYDNFFNTKEIEQLINSQKTRVPTFRNYMFHVVNLISIYSDENALIGLKDIKDLINLQNILRLKSMQDSFKVAEKIFEIILKNIDLSIQKEKEAKKMSEQTKSGNGEGNSKGDGKNGGEGDDKNDGDGNGEGDDKNDGDGNGEGDDKNDGDGSCDKVKKGSLENGNETDVQKEANKEQIRKAGKYANASNERVKKAMEAAFGEIEKLLNHKIKKQELPDGVTEKVSSLSGMNVRIKSITMNHPSKGSIKTRVVVIPKLTHNLIDQHMLPITTTEITNRDSLDDGIKLGKSLVNKIRIRNESRKLISPRQKNGRLMQRSLSDLSYDSENIFYKLTSEEFKSMHFHISVDASGSMSGDKWGETIKLLTAITYASCKIKNIDVVVDFRSQFNTISGTNTQRYFPFVLIAFDSRHQSFKEYTDLISHIDANGMTPEGMCFHALLDEYVAGNHLKDSVFINISDGYPGCTVEYDNGYGITEVSYNEFGIQHTAEIVKRIRKMNIEVISYFINSNWGADFSYFKKMYGNDAKEINPSNVVDIAKTINEKLLKK